MARWYRQLDHTADTGIETTAPTLPEVLARAARAMFDLMYGSIDSPPSVTFSFRVPSEDPPQLLYDILAELLWRAEAREVAVTEVEVSLDAGAAVVRAAGVPFDRVRLAGPPIKAVTWHDLACERRGDGWYARVLFDV